jgi:hypothetical protein
LNEEYDAQQKRKRELEKEYEEAKRELEDIENTFPKEILELKQRIADAKNVTKEYEEKT